MDIFKLLQQDIQSKIKKKRIYGRDCSKLSQQIFDDTQRQVSSSTLKRFFGLIKSNFKPSKYTLDTLAIYIGFRDWNDYVNGYENSKHSVSDNGSWIVLKNRINQVTHHSLESLKQKTSYNKTDFIFRTFVKDRFDKLVQNNTSATIFVAPDGYGKSTLMIQLVERYFFENNAPLKDDIACLIDGRIFFEIYSKNTNIDLLNQLINFKINSSLSFYFQKNQGKRKGRIWLFIDNVDEVFFDKERYYSFIENLMRILMINEGGWFKLILTCRPENLEPFTLILKNNLLLKSYWYDVEFFKEKYIDAINIPLLNVQEVKSVFSLQKVENKFEHISTRYKDVMEIIVNPYFLSLFPGAFRENEDITEIILLNRFIKAKILSLPFIGEKLQLIHRYMALCNRGEKTSSVEKDQLLYGSGFLLAYQQLVANGIIYEYIIQEDTIDLRFLVSFNQRIIFNYMVLRDWSKEKKLSVELFFEMKEFYGNNTQMQCDILKLFLKLLAHNKEFEMIKKIHVFLGKSVLENKDLTDADGFMPCINSVIEDMAKNNEELNGL